MPKPIKLGTITKEMIAAYMGQIGARGGKSTAANMTPAQLSARGKKAVEAREAKRKDRSLLAKLKS